MPYLLSLEAMGAGARKKFGPFGGNNGEQTDAVEREGGKADELGAE